MSEGSNSTRQPAIKKRRHFGSKINFGAVKKSGREESSGNINPNPRTRSNIVTVPSILQPLSTSIPQSDGAAPLACYCLRFSRRKYSAMAIRTKQALRNPRDCPSFASSPMCREFRKMVVRRIYAPPTHMRISLELWGIGLRDSLKNCKHTLPY